MIDIHCHILSGIDDGPKDRKGSLRMAREAVVEGITCIIATPHQRYRNHENTKSTIMERVAVMNRDLKETGIPLKIYPGQEARVSKDFIENYEKDKVLSLNDAHQYIHVEVLSGQVPQYIGPLLKNIRNKGLTPIIVHPERNRDFYEAPALLYKLVKAGALTQITASSITGHFGEPIQSFAYELIEYNLTHFVASDAHPLPSRLFRMKEAFENIERTFGADLSHKLQENAERLLNGETVTKEVPVYPKGKRAPTEDPSQFT